MAEEMLEKSEHYVEISQSSQDEAENLLANIKKAIEASLESPSSIAKSCKIDTASMSRFMNGTQKSFHSRSLYRLAKYLGLVPSVGSQHTVNEKQAIFRPLPNAPLEDVEGSDVCSVPVIGGTGAGSPVELFEMDPDYYINIPSTYYKEGIVCFYVEGESMEPTIKKGSFVGIAAFDGTLTESGVYLVNLPPFGRTIKRIKMGPNGEILLHSDNPKNETRELPYEGYEDVILGRVVWVLQKM